MTDTFFGVSPYRLSFMTANAAKISLLDHVKNPTADDGEI